MLNFFNQYKVTYIDSENGIIRCQNNMEVSAKVIVGADGSKSFVSSLLNEKFNYFNASQYLVEINTSSRANIIDTNAVEFVDLFAISKILPGFLWCIPTSDSSFRVGLFSNNSYKDQKEILNSFLATDERFKESSIIEKYHGKIPIFDKNKKIVKDRILLIGDAASQLKPTTGGGLVIGFDTTNLAKDAIIKSLDNDNINFLKDYEQNFKKKYAKELNYQIRVQKNS
ncbi:FAD-dependent monooxygenase [Methanobrevibacter arboriphilus]|uniref:FAD-dependent monooxygenase n=1 Tax=Methanobrevibacter arboriphilus TaxID=39441 RepID=UPI000AE25810|nr:NAD(P)/FAD-dependent oxidoreductase [Methanobrevibacter arboriphilus]